MTTSPADLPQLVVVGAASRDRTPEDPRGWRLGGAVTYAALTAARLGLRTGAIVGVDAHAARAVELDALTDAGVELVPVALSNGPVFDNIEQPGGRRQVAHSAAARIPPASVPPGWRRAPAWLLGPVAGELADDWARVPSDEALVAVGWQGLLRRVVEGAAVERVEPAKSRILARADLVAVSRDDLAAATDLAALCMLLRPGATLIVTAGADGGVVAEVGEDGPRRLHRYPAIAPDRLTDPTGAGDVFLATVLAARVQPRLVGGRIGQRFDLRLAAAVASLLVEEPGLDGVPTRDRVRRRMAEATTRAAARVAPDPDRDR